jgi:hypothetical protein
MTEDQTIHSNVYHIGDVIAAMVFASIFLFIAFMLGYGLGISKGIDEGVSHILQVQSSEKKTP